jgi:chitodextrinase
MASSPEVIALIAALVWTQTSRADNVVVSQPAPAPAPATPVVVAPSAAPATDQATYTGPDRRLIPSGLITFGLAALGSF